jgi:hypothetical protein
MNDSIFSQESEEYYIDESVASDKFEIEVALEINTSPGYIAERPKVSTKYSDVLVTNTMTGRRSWVEVKMNHTDNLSNPRVFYDGNQWDTTYTTGVAKQAVDILNNSEDAKEFINALKKFVGKDYIKIPTTKAGLRDINAVSLNDMKEFFNQPSINRYIANMNNVDLGKIVSDHYLYGKAEPAYYMQAGDDFYRIGDENPFNLSKDIPLLTGFGDFKVRVSTRSSFYEVQAEIKIKKMPNSKYSVKPNTKKINPFKK